LWPPSCSSPRAHASGTWPCALAAAIITNPYRIHRITSFLDPYQDAQGKGYHMIQSMVAVANGQFFGRGLGHGLQKFGYLPEDTTDFLFAIVCEELGVFGAALVIFLYGALLWSVLSVIRREPSRFLKLIALGVMATVGLQALINLAVVTGLGPTKGIALPLLSSGGTGWILTAASLGLVIAMDRTQGALQWYRVAEKVRTGELAPAVAIDAAPEALAPAPLADDSRFAPPPPPAFAALVARQEILSDPLDAPIAQQIIADPAPTPEESTAPEVSEVTEPEPCMIADQTVLTTVEAAEAVVFPLVSESSVHRETLNADASGVEVGQTGLLFSTGPAEPAADDHSAEIASTMPPPRVVITDDARDWPDSTRLRPA
jgi:hypothetical protein